jgi:exodeoxyribonuclease V gamma subunit
VLRIHRAERADGLATTLATVLEVSLPDPFTSEVVAVPTHGMERWLTQRLAGRLGASGGRADGICANVVFPSPASALADALAGASGIDPAVDPWAPRRILWSLVETVEACLAEQWLAPLARHLNVEPGRDAVRSDRSRRISTVRHMAGLFSRYELERPQMILAWADGRDEDASGAPLEIAAAWQAELWRRLRERIGVQSFAERLDPACARLREEPVLAALPDRVCFFGLTRMPAAHVRVLQALGAAREIHLFVLHPSPVSWDRVSAAVAEHGPVERRERALVVALPRNPLLASWGRDAREFQLVLASSDALADDHGPLAAADSSLLAHVQTAIRADRPPPGTPAPGCSDDRPPLAQGDRSIQIHACHGRARQVEVLRDAILHLMAEDSTLEPRDVIVMCPDIETFAPLIQATFGVADEDEISSGRHAPKVDHLRVRLADRSVRQTNPLLGVVSRLLELAEQRVTASQILDLVDREPVRRRFGFDDEALARLEEWVSASAVCWGLDADHRRNYGMDRVTDGTWRAGLDRLALGVAMAENGPRLFGGVLPLDDVDSGSIDLAGRFAELMDRLSRALRRLATPQPLVAWVAAITSAADELTATAPRDAWQRSQFQALFADLTDEAQIAGGLPAAPLELADIRSLLADRLAGRPTRANFRTGHLTVCTLAPMRSVPHRVVCLLGLDDTVFPRRGPRDGDDLLLEDPHVGDRDPRSEDRQILLDALLAATDTLLITYTGRDERTNAPHPPSVPVAELLDVIEGTVRLDETWRSRSDVVLARHAVTFRHRLQPFDADNFIAGKLLPDEPWSFDRTTLDGARATVTERTETRSFLEGPLALRDAPLIDLNDLVSFASNPISAFLSQRLGVGTMARAAEVEDALPIELDQLARWSVGDRLLAHRLAGVDASAAAAVERARGTLPPGSIGDETVARLMPLVDAVLAAAARHHSLGEADPVDLRVDLPNARAIVGTVTGVSGEVLQAVLFSRVSAAHRLAAWVRLLVLTAADPERPMSAVTVGRARGGNARVTVASIPALASGPDERHAVALDHLTMLVELYDRGMCEPLPVFCETSAAYASGGHAAQTRAAGAWESSWDQRGNRRPGEQEREEYVRVLGADVPFEALLAESPRADETGQGWDETQPTRFGRYALLLWSGLLAREALIDE